VEQIFKSIVFLIFFFSFICSKEYFISYQLISKNGILIYYKLNFSKCLSKTHFKKNFLFKIKVKKNYDLDKLLSLYKDEIFEKLLTYQNVIYAYSNLVNFQLNSFQKLTFTPKRFDIILKNRYLYFYLRK